MFNSFLRRVGRLIRFDAIFLVWLIFLATFLLLPLSSMVRAANAEATSDTEQRENAEIAEELTNPIADLMIFPIQFNYDQDIGPRDDGWRLQMNVQPVIPFHLTEHWNLISRIIVPVIYQEDIYPGEGSQFGLGDTSMSMYFSPKEPTSSGIIWGAGPQLLFPTASDKLLGREKWGAGLGVIALVQPGPWAVGALGHHVWSYAGDSDRQDVNNSFIQPFLAYTWPSAWTVSAFSESNYNWESEDWSVPVYLALARVVRWGKLPVRLQGVVGYWVESTDEGPEGFSFRFQVNFVLPK
jgi:hypothetical protein